GPQVQRFEAALSAYCGGRPVRTLNSGTAALALGLRLAGVGPGGEVVTTPLSRAATAHVILEGGAHPVVVDVHARTPTIDPERAHAQHRPGARCERGHAAHARDHAGVSRRAAGRP